MFSGASQNPHLLAILLCHILFSYIRTRGSLDLESLCLTGNDYLKWFHFSLLENAGALCSTLCRAWIPFRESKSAMCLKGSSDIQCDGPLLLCGKQRATHNMMSHEWAVMWKRLSCMFSKNPENFRIYVHLCFGISDMLYVVLWICQEINTFIGWWMLTDITSYLSKHIILYSKHEQGGWTL